MTFTGFNETFTYVTNINEIKQKISQKGKIGFSENCYRFYDDYYGLLRKVYLSF